MCDTLQSVKESLKNIENEETNEFSVEYYNNGGISLLDMPVEIILKICSFLDAHFLKTTLKCVCQRLQDILSDDNLWRNWVHSRIKGCFPPILHLNTWEESPIDWESVCVDIDFERNKWTNVRETMKHIVIKDMHYASVDTMLLVNKGELCISGSRDRSMALLKVSDIAPGDSDNNGVYHCEGKPLKMCNDAHSGWVWDLAPDYVDSTSVIYSASWDNSVKAWDLETFECLEKFGCGMSVLSLVGIGKEVMAGLYSKKVLIFDQRSGTNPAQSYKAHNGAVLDLFNFNNMVASVSADKTMTIYDRVAGKILKNNIQIPFHDRAYPVCISWSQYALYIGDSRGYLNLFNPEDHVYMKSLEFWEQPPITQPQIKIKCCHQSEGNMIVCSDRGEIKFLCNSYPPEEYATIKSYTIDITELCYLNGILAVSTCDSALEFWIPNDRFDKICLGL